MSDLSMDETQEIQLLMQGDPAGLEVLVKKYQIQAVRVAFLVVWNHELAEDIVQNAFLRVYERIQQFDRQRPFGPWFLKIVVNEAIKASTGQKGQVSWELASKGDEISLFNSLSDAVPGPEESLQRQELRTAIRKAMEALTPEQRAVIVCRYYLGFSQLEMENELGVPASTVKWRLHAARKRLGIILHVYGDKQ